MFGEEGIKLIILYQKTLEISISEAVIILMKNKTARAILQEELALTFTGKNKNLSSLLSSTILRNFYDFNPIMEDEKKLVKEYYDIEIGKDNYLKNNLLEKGTKLENCEEDEALVRKYVEKYLRYENIRRKTKLVEVKESGKFGKTCLRAAKIRNKNQDS